MTKTNGQLGSELEDMLNTFCSENQIQTNVMMGLLVRITGTAIGQLAIDGREASALIKTINGLLVEGVSAIAEQHGETMDATIDRLNLQVPLLPLVKALAESCEAINEIEAKRSGKGNVIPFSRLPVSDTKH